MSISHGSPELGTPELTANLRAAGFSVEQHDWNIEFLADHLMQTGNLRAVIEAMGGGMCLPPAAARHPRMFLDLLFGRGVAEKSRVFNGETTPDFSEFLAVNRAKYSLCHGVPDEEVRRRLDAAWPDGPARPAGDGSWSSSPDDLVVAIKHFSKNHANFFVDFLAGLQEVWLTPRSYRMDDVQEFVSRHSGVLESFFERKLNDVCSRGVPRVLGCSIHAMSQVAPSLLLARVAKRMDPGIRVVFGGPWCGMARRLFPTIPEFFDDVDGVILYEGERPLAEYVAAARSSGDPDTASNLVHRRKGVVVENPITTPLPLTDLRFPTYDGLPMSLYFDRKLTLRLFRGCYWGRCIFCNDTCDSVARVTGFHSGRSDLLPDAYLDRMVEHIRECTRLYGQRRFNHADTTVPPGMLKQFAETILRSNISIEWFSFMRFVPISKRTCRTMNESGCRELKIGLESTSDDDLRRLRKGFLMKTVHECLDAFEGTDIRILAFVMGLPYQTPEDFTASLRTIVDRMPRVDDTILQRFVLVRESPLLRDPESFGMRVTADLRRDLRVYALEYENPSGMNLYQFMSLANSMHKFMNYARTRRDDRTDLYRNEYWSCREADSNGIPDSDQVADQESREARSHALASDPTITVGRSRPWAQAFLEWGVPVLTAMIRDLSGWSMGEVVSNLEPVAIAFRHSSGAEVVVRIERRDESKAAYHRTRTYNISYVRRNSGDTVELTPEEQALLSRLVQTISAVETVRSGSVRRGPVVPDGSRG